MLTTYSKDPFYLGDWCVLPEQSRLQKNSDSHHLQPKLMEILLYLAEHPMAVISTDKLIEACWMGQPMTDNPIHKAIAQLRKALGDSSDVPRYIKTVPRKGYMLIAKISKGKTDNTHIEPFWRDQPPFPGTDAYQSQHKDIFFGRDQAISDLLSYIERIDCQDNVIINLSGVSGCGKSSFIQAGLVPKLLNPYKPYKLTFTDALYWQATPDNDVITLIDLLYQKQLFKPTISADQVQQLWQKNPNEFRQCLVAQKDDDNRRIVLFIDQVEKWLIPDADNSNAESRITVLLDFILQLHANRQFLIIFSARDEATSLIKSSPAFHRLSGTVMDFRLPQIRASQHKAWIQSTMQAAGLFFEINPNRYESLLDLIMHAIERHHYNLSTIQSLLLKLYERRDNSKLQYESFQHLGGFEGIIDQQAEDVFEACSNKQKQSIITLFPQWVGYKSMLENIPRIQKVPSTVVMKVLTPDSLIQLIDQRLLFSEHINEQTFVSFNEARLPQLWGTLSQWIEDNRSHLLKQSEIQFMAKRWLQHKKNSHYLMSGVELKQLQAEQRPDYYLNRDEQAFIQESKNKSNRNLTLKRIKQGMSVLLIMGLAWWANNSIKLNNLQQNTEQQLSGLTAFITEEMNPLLKENGQWTLLERINTNLLNVFEQKTGRPSNRQQLSSHAAALNIMGELSFNQRKSDAAVDYFRQSERLIQAADSSNQSELLAHLMLSQYWLGYLDFSKNKYAQAEHYWQAYLQTSLQLQKLEPENSNWQLEQSYALNNLGSLSERTSDFEQATDYFEQSITIKSKLFDQQADNMTLLADLADSLSWQGNIYRKQGLLNQALNAYRDSSELTQQLKTKQHNTNIKLHRESQAIHRMALVMLDMGKVTEAQELAKTALDKALLLNEIDHQNNTYKKELINLYLFNANILRLMDNHDQSLMFIQRANQLIDYFKINLTMTPQIAAYQMLLKREQAVIFNHFGQTESALTATQEGLETWDAYELNKNKLAQITYVMLHLNSAQFIKQGLSENSNQAQQNRIQEHLDNAWQEINHLMAQIPEDRQLMAINLAVSFARNSNKINQQLIQSLIDSEYRNPEYYQPLVDKHLITFNQ